MTDKLVERLRHVGYLNSDNGDWGPRNPDGSEAADLIEAQQAEIERQKNKIEALERAGFELAEKLVEQWNAALSEKGVSQ